MGSKIERLAKDEAVSLTVLARACVAQHQKMSKLLTSLKSRLDEKTAEQYDLKTKHEEEVAQLRSLLTSTKAELLDCREEASLFRQHAQKLAELLGAQRNSHAAHMEVIEKRCAEAEEKAVAYGEKIASLTKKQLRSKEISAKLYEEKKKARGEEGFW